jgi:phospholipid/cholesterol/gamma-HCH transport system substrate-binding protein
MSPRATDKRGLSNLQIGLIAIVVTVIGFYLAFAKSIPFAGDGYQLKAVFQDAQSLRVKSPVRVAGVDVGKVTKVEHLTDENGDGVDAAVVTMSIDDDARPVREDATMALRPRLFLEGNLFVDLSPGSPQAPELESGSVIPLEQTSISVQLDQVLTSLQAPVRENLQIFLKEFGTALCGENPPESGCEPGSGGEGFQESFRTSPAAYGSTAQVNEALLGTQPGDLVGVVRNLGTTIEALDRNEVQLKDLVTNFSIVTGSFAAESDALEQAIVELPQALAEGRPALAKLNTAFPQLRAFSRELLPGVRAANKALDDATPWIGQLRALVSESELRGLVGDLRPTIPELARLTQASLPFLEESRALSSCFNEVIIPWGNLPVPSAEAGVPDDPVYKQTGYGLVGVGGESRSGDAQGQWFRVLGGGGQNTVSFATPDAPGGVSAGVVPFEIQGVQPAKQSSAKTPFRPDQPCENQEVPDLATGPTTPVPTATPTSASASTSATADASSTSTPAYDRVMAISNRFAAAYTELLRADALEQGGQLAEAESVRTQAAAEMQRLNRTLLPKYHKALGKLTGGNG